MELSERFIRTLESEGFASVYEHQDKPGTVYEPHSHTGKVSLYVTDGSITFDIDGEKKEVVANERFNVPVGVEHSDVVGPEGWIVIVGEEGLNVLPNKVDSCVSSDNLHSSCKEEEINGDS